MSLLVKAQRIRFNYFFLVCAAASRAGSFLTAAFNRAGSFFPRLLRASFSHSTRRLYSFFTPRNQSHSEFFSFAVRAASFFFAALLGVFFHVYRARVSLTHRVKFMGSFIIPSDQTRAEFSSFAVSKKKHARYTRTTNSKYVRSATVYIRHLGWISTGTVILTAYKMTCLGGTVVRTKIFCSVVRTANLTSRTC